MQTTIILEKIQADRDTLSARAREIIRACLADEYGEVDIVKGENGKPFISGHPDIHISLSHTKNAVLVGVSDSPIGVDIEQIRAYNTDIPRRFFTPDEQEFIADAVDGTTAFFDIWTKKEAYLKYLGTGLKKSLSSFSVFALSDGKFSTFSDGEYAINVFSTVKCDCIFTAI